jgi:tetratricopeptide (TPR) repeat protein
LRRWDSAVADYSRALDRKPPPLNAFECLRFRADAHVQLRQWEKAAADYSEMIKMEPSNPEGWEGRGNVHIQSRKWGKAIADLTQALRYQPLRHLSYCQRGLAYLATGDAGKAISDCSAALRLNPRCQASLSNRGFAHGQMRQWEQASADYAAIDQGARGPRTWYCHLLLRLAQGDREEYGMGCIRMVQLLGKTSDSTVAGALAWTCVLAPEGAADYTVVVRLAEKRLSAVPGNASANIALGAALYRAGRYDDAVERLQASLKAHGNRGSVHAWLFLAMAHQRLEHADDASKWLEKAAGAIDRLTRARPPGDRVSLPWDQRLSLQLLLREAEALVKGDKP